MEGLDPLRAAIRQASDPLVVMRRVVEQALALIPASDGAVLELLQGERLTYACAAGALEPQVGSSVPVCGSLSGLAVRTGQTLCCEDCSSDPRADPAAYQREGAVSLICVPLFRVGEAIGALKVTASRPRAFSEEDVGTLARLAGFISTAIGAISELSTAASAMLASAADSECTATGDRPGPRGVREFVPMCWRPGSSTRLICANGSSGPSRRRDSESSRSRSSSWTAVG